jgi:hypothetical protein
MADSQVEVTLIVRLVMTATTTETTATAAAPQSLEVCRCVAPCLFAKRKEKEKQ